MRDYLEAGTIVFLFTVAEWLGSRASQKATAVMSSLMSMAPQKATLAETGEIVNVEDVKLNTNLAVKAGEIIPIDGIVVEGTCEVDEKTLTGESFPVAKQKDSTVWAGTCNVNGYICVRTTALAEDCAVAKMARLVEEAQINKPSIQRLIDKCAKYYTPAVVLVSAGLVAVPAALKLHNLRHWFYLALVVLVGTCPCGLILSTPVATFCSLSRAATTGLLIKGGDYLETLAKIKVMAFDKTGTITRGEFTLTNFMTLADDVSLSTLLYWVSSIESKSSHPIASVLVDYGQSRSIKAKPENVEEFQNFPGEGVFGKIDGRDIYIGNQKIGQRAKCSVGSSTSDLKKEGRTSVYVYSGGALIGAFSLSDNCRTGAIDAIKDLKSMGIRTALLTGDGQSAAMHAQEQLGHVLDLVYAELMPEDKARIIQEFKKEGPVAMVGDGVNDAPALAAADVGISMGVSGSALATETGHVVLMSNDIRKIPKAIKLAKKTRQKVIENIIFSITTKAGVLAFAFAGHPLVWLAVLVDVFTCLIVILNSMLLLRGDHEHSQKCFRLFSCHSHKSKCLCTSQHPKMNEQCCSKSTAPKTCESARCSSQNYSTPRQTSSKCHLADSLHSSAKSQQCCPTPGGQTISESSECSSQNCSSSCQTSKCVDTAYRLHHHSNAHDPHEKLRPSSSPGVTKSSHCSSNECPSKCQSNTHESSACEEKFGCLSEYYRSTCCVEEHCLDSLESQGRCAKVEKLDEVVCCGGESCQAVKHMAISGCFNSKDSHNSSNSEHHLLVNHHSHEQKSCCKAIDVNKFNCRMQEQMQLHDEDNGSGCNDHCLRSNEIHGANDHVVLHGTRHAHAVSEHACTSLRKREVGACCKSFRQECCTSQGHFVAGLGGLTKIVIE